jgi:hypothetical protein
LTLGTDNSPKLTIYESGLVQLKRLQVGDLGNQLYRIEVGKCSGPPDFFLPNATFALTCPVNSSLGGSQMLILPEMWIPGSGCIVTTDKPRVVMIGNNFGVSATFTNRCGGYQTGSQRGLAWLVFQITP